MNRAQKMSWWMVMWMGAGILVGGIAVAVLYFKIGFPRAWAGWGLAGIGGFGGLAPLIFKKDPGPVQYDERDQEIALKANRASMALSYLVFGLLSMGIWGIDYSFFKIETISVHVLPLIYGAAGITAFFVQALTTLILYGKDNKPMEGGAA